MAADRNPFKAIAVPATVVAELEARSDMSKLLKWTAKRVPWIHVMSMAEGCSANFSPLGKGSGNVFELYGSTSSTALYDTTSKFPLPVITGIDVGSLGNLGTTRKATIKIKIYTDEHLVEMQKCYFIPGMDVRVQFGWSESCLGLPPKDLYMNVGPRQEALCEIATRAQTNASYDGFQGIVTNFNYNLQPDNSWDCSIEINSAAEAFADGTIEDTECGCGRKMEQTDAEGNTKKAVVKYGRLYTMMFDIFKDSRNAQFYVNDLSVDTPKGLVEYLLSTDEFYEGIARTQDGKDDSGFLEGVFSFVDGYNTIESYISWGMLEAAINKYTIPNTLGRPYGQVDSSGISLPKPTNLMSSDPRICIIPGQRQLTENTRKIGSEVSPADGTGTISLCSISLNVIFLMMELKKVFDGDKKMSTFLRAVIDKVNDVCGNPWNIEIVSSGDTLASCKSPEGGGAISVIDHKSFKNEGDIIYEIKATVDKSAVRNISLDMKMTGAMKTQALYAGGTQQGGTSSKNDGDATACKGLSFLPFYIGRGSGKNQAMRNATPGKKDNAKCGCDEVDTPAKTSPPTKSELIEQCIDDISDQTCQALRNEIIKEMSGEAKPPHCTGVMLPFDFGFECDGIGGFRFSQLISCNRIPQAIRDKLVWQITKVDHTITANDWTTKVGTVCRLKSL